MSEIIYYESEDRTITIADDFIKVAHMSFQVEELTRGEAYVGKPDQTVNLAFALVGIFCIVLGKIRSGQLAQIVDMNVLFTASNYFDLAGLILILIALLITLPQKESYGIRFTFKNGRKKSVILKDNRIEIMEINKAIEQALRFAKYRGGSR